jgi:hypothetical protein
MHACCGANIQQDTLFSTVNPEGRVPKDLPLHPIPEMVNAAVAGVVRPESGFPDESTKQARFSSLLKRKHPRSLNTFLHPHG